MISGSKWGVKRYHGMRWRKGHFHGIDGRRHQRPGPKPLRGRGSLRFRLEDLGERDLLQVNGDTALYLKALGLHVKSQEGMVEAGLTKNCGFPLGESAWPGRVLGTVWGIPKFLGVARGAWICPASQHGPCAVRPRSSWPCQEKKPTPLLTNMTAGWQSLMEWSHGIWGGEFSNLFKTEWNSQHPGQPGHLF